MDELKEFYELNICLHGIKKMCLNKKDQILFVVSYDNSINFVEFKEKEWALVKESEGEGINIKEEFLYEEIKLERKIQVLNEL